MTNKLYLIHPEHSESGTLETLPETQGIALMKNMDVQANGWMFNIDDKVCITSEASLDIVREKLKDTAKQKAIDYLKDKHLFREIVRDMYPDYQYQRITFDEIKSIPIHKKSVLKPVKGCFGTAVKIIDENTDLNIISEEIAKEISKNSDVLSENVLSKNDFILEDYITGDEYAVDMFYDENGEPHIVNIYYHPMPKIEAYLHMMYYTSKAVFDKIYELAMDFFRKLNKILDVKNFVLHSEFKFDGTLFPIEINSMRFGGMGLGNMIYHAVGVNPYACFKNGVRPNWDDIWQKYPEDIFAYFIAYNGTTIDTSTQEPDVEKLKRDFTEVLCEQIFDYKTQLAFGVFCIKEHHQNIKKLLEIEFNDYFKPINATEQVL